jgi:hypothetical protein
MAAAMNPDLIAVISHLGRQANNLNDAVHLFQPELANRIGNAVLLIDHLDYGMSPSIAQSTAAFLDSREFPFRGLYTAPLTVGHRKVGRLIACYGSFGAPEKTLPEVTSHVARQLSTILARNCHLANGLEAA